MRLLSCRFFLGGILVLVLIPSIYAQHTRYDISASFAEAGQYSFAGSAGTGFFTKPLIWNLKVQLGTDYLQSISMALEHIGETRTRSDLWSDDPSQPQYAYNALVSESLSMTFLYLEMIRTIVRIDEFRIGVGAELGYGIGGVTAVVTKRADGTMKTVDSYNNWTSFIVGIIARARYSVYTTDKIDVGITLAGRYWGLPTLGPIANSPTYYEGPHLTSLHELGYLAGISVGIK